MEHLISDKPVYFLSDTHLPILSSQDFSAEYSIVLDFLKSIRGNASALVLLGDIFDFWFEWKHTILKKTVPILAELANLVNTGARIIYLGGNHDGHLGSFFSEELDIETCRDEKTLYINNFKFLLLHGDGIAKDDKGYRFLKSILRSKVCEYVFKNVLPQNFGIRAFTKGSTISHRHFSCEERFGIDSYKSYAFDKLNDGYNYVVMGHIHQSIFFEHPNGGYLSIGDWIKNHNYGIFIDNNLVLKSFS